MKLLSCKFDPINACAKIPVLYELVVVVLPSRSASLLFDMLTNSRSLEIWRHEPDMRGSALKLIGNCNYRGIGGAGARGRNRKIPFATVLRHVCTRVLNGDACELAALNTVRNNKHAYNT